MNNHKYTIVLSQHDLNIICDGLEYIYENSETGEYRAEAYDLSRAIRKIIIGDNNGKQRTR